MIDPSFVLAAGNFPRLWYALPLVVVVSLVYGATRHEYLKEVAEHSIRSAFWVVGFIGDYFAIIYVPASGIKGYGLENLTHRFDFGVPPILGGRGFGRDSKKRQFVSAGDTAASDFRSRKDHPSPASISTPRQPSHFSSDRSMTRSTSQIQPKWRRQQEHVVFDQA